jgi:hypothetical protein
MVIADGLAAGFLAGFGVTIVIPFRFEAAFLESVAAA